MKYIFGWVTFLFVLLAIEFDLSLLSIAVLSALASIDSMINK